MNPLRTIIAFPYGAVMALRNALFDWGVLRSTRFSLPIICIGNLSLGGTGKTPHTEYLVRLLHSWGMQVATLSRGYGRKTHGFRKVADCQSAWECGDEPWQMQQSLGQAAQCYVCEDRVQGIQRLLAESENRKARPDVVVLDDAFQHRYVKAGLYILLTDYARMYVDDYVVPAGRLREWRSGARRADIIIVTKCPADLSCEDCTRIAHRLSPDSHQRVYFSHVCYGNLQPFSPEACAAQPRPTSALALSGIAKAEMFVEEVQRRFETVKALSFGDHHNFSDKDLAEIHRQAESVDCVVTTAKDAARLAALRQQLSPGLVRKLYVLPIHVEMLHQDALSPSETFHQTIHDYVTTHSGNRCLD